ncbi:MAG: DUF1592 domain-containing protein [Gammaproteobacteria bacterium]|nr:DUF1592 domain-containing protein [Gammaproteobacteria bacterium]
MVRRNLRTVAMTAVGAFTAVSPLFAAADTQTEQNWSFIESYCTECHNFEEWAGGVAFDTMSPDNIAHDAEVWEATIRKLRGGQMPPPGTDRPEESNIQNIAQWLESTLDNAAQQGHVGRVPLKRLNRREYENAIRDLLGMNVDATALLPADDIKAGYDNIAAALQVTPTFIDQYLNAARTIAHDAIGDARPIPIMQTYGNVADMIISLPPRGIDGTGSQQRHNQGMPFGTRGGMTVEHNFMADGEYELNIGDLALAREVPNMEFENTVVALLDGTEFFRTTIGGEQDHKTIDQLLDDAVARINERLRNIKFHATAGQHTITVTFLQRTMAESDERVRIPALEGGQDRIHGVHALQIRGPLSVSGLSDTVSRERIFVCYPREPAEEAACATEIVTSLANRAFRRPATEAEIGDLVAFYQASRKTQDFEASIRDTLSAVLVSPHFIYRAEAGVMDADSQSISDYELASRLSFFLWSSIPDEELLGLARQGKLKDSKTLRAQIQRMLADDKARALVDDFAGQWLHLARLDEIQPNGRLFRYASRSLDPRTMFKEEIGLFVESVLLSDQSVLRLLDADYTYLNERLAMHYGIEDVKGSKFRRVQLTDTNRFGLLGKGGILMMTANPNRTSPVLRGSWILERILGTPPATPPPNVEALPENTGSGPARTVRERLEQHREQPHCFACHAPMDSLGMALENFNTVGQFRAFDPDTLTEIDTTGVLPDGTVIKGPTGLREALIARSDMFVGNLTRNLLTYALGRELDYRDMPNVRAIVREAARDDYRFESIIYQIVNSDAFMKRERYLSSSEEAADKQASLD